MRGSAGWYVTTNGTTSLEGIHTFTKFLKNFTSTSKKIFFKIL